MRYKILILGSTGQLGSKLLKYISSQNLSVDTATCYTQSKKLIHQKNKYKIKNIFSLSNDTDYKNFLSHLHKKKFKLIYFLDYGASSLRFFDIINRNNKNSLFAIANKEMIIAGGSLLINKIQKKQNKIIPLDSEHFSLFRIMPKNQEIKKIFITASGGPFYFKKNINLSNVSMKQVLSHPKWKMGINNTIDSSNFINKVLEIFELSILYNIDLTKIDFLISKEAFIHSLILFNDNTISVNCFNNNMLIPLVKPLNSIFNTKNIFLSSKKIFDISNFNLTSHIDKRFIIFKHLNKIKKMTHMQQISFLVLNNIAHSKYQNNEIKYNDIIKFILSNIPKNDNNINLNSFNNILDFIKNLKNKYA